MSTMHTTMVVCIFILLASNIILIIYYYATPNSCASSYVYQLVVCIIRILSICTHSTLCIVSIHFTQKRRVFLVFEAGASRPPNLSPAFFLFCPRFFKKMQNNPGFRARGTLGRLAPGPPRRGGGRGARASPPRPRAPGVARRDEMYVCDAAIDRIRVNTTYSREYEGFVMIILYSILLE